jgi:hypothetical protein
VVVVVVLVVTLGLAGRVMVVVVVVVTVTAPMAAIPVIVVSMFRADRRPGRAAQCAAQDGPARSAHVGTDARTRRTADRTTDDRTVVRCECHRRECERGHENELAHGTAP